MREELEARSGAVDELTEELDAVDEDEDEDGRDEGTDEGLNFGQHCFGFRGLLRGAQVPT